jgi:hypothetical protein
LTVLLSPVNIHPKYEIEEKEGIGEEMGWEKEMREEYR